MTEAEHPLLSVVVAIVSDTTDGRCDPTLLAGCLASLADQVDPPTLEVIVPYCGEIDGLDEIRERFSEFLFVRVDDLAAYTGAGGSREHHDELRARGLAHARGRYIALVEDHAHVDRHWCRKIVEAHEDSDYAGIGGAIENGERRPLNWAVYFCDFGRYQNPVPAGESWIASDANVSYKRSALDEIRDAWLDVFHETKVNARLFDEGCKLGLSPEIVVFQHRGRLRLGAALKERFIWGRSYAATRSELLGRAKVLLLAALCPLLPAVLLWRMTRTVVGKRRCVSAFFKAAPLTALLVAWWSLGEFAGYVAGHSRSAREATLPATVGRVGQPS